MRGAFRLVQALLLLFTFPRDAYGLANIQTLFDTSSSTGCSSQLTTLNTYLTEVRALLQAAQTGIENWKNNIDYQLMLMSWLGISFEGGLKLNAVMDDYSEDAIFFLVKGVYSPNP